ncbi:MAG: hypothetical protein CMH26_09745 [Micavibrio sp.]|nr:hypothetical protein [Micavibrio sp.]|tara:strand:- start:17 stop:247 length:231 start_codon:yes stop_codon:yes gene_type:complete
MDNSEKDKIRLSDRILSALQLSLEQEDLKIAELLTSAMEQSMTRNTGGGEFIERRDYPPEIEDAMDMLHKLRSKNK